MARDLCLLSCLPILPAVRAAGVALGAVLVLLGVGLALGLELGAVVGVGLMPVAWAALVCGCRGLVVRARCGRAARWSCAPWPATARPAALLLLGVYFHPWDAAAVLGRSGGRVGPLCV